MYTISVIVPIYNAERYLLDLFETIEKNAFEDGDEILLIDNGSSDKSLQMCLERAEQMPSLYKVYSYTEKAGSYAVRNYGVSVSKGECLVFTDSDTKPVSGWISAIRSEIKQGIIVAGKIYLDNLNNGLWECFDQIAHLNSEKNARENCVATANMAVIRKDFIKIGPFEERFSGGDYEWSQRAVNCGMKIQFNANAQVHHPTRKSFIQILKKEQRIAYGMGNHYRIHNKSLIALIIIYFLKMFKIDTNVRYTRQLFKYGIRKRELFIFNIFFMRIRLSQLLFAVKGYRMSNVRKLGIK